MKGQKYDEAKAGVDIENFASIPLEEQEFYAYRNWLEPHLMEHPEDSTLSEDELMKKFRNTQPPKSDTSFAEEKSVKPQDSEQDT